MSFRWLSHGKSDVGRVRKVNEDALLIREDCGLWLVADGMGGHEGGDYASQAVVDAFSDLRPPSSLAQLAATLQSNLDAANKQVLEYAEKYTKQGMMGTTVVAFVVYGGNYYCYWCGDSRAYLLRGGVLTQLTKDHSVIQDMIDNGELLPDDAEAHPSANQITNALGISEPLELERVQGQLLDSDVFLICSDGLFREMKDSEIEFALNDNPKNAVESLLNTSLERGARDNTTIIVVSVEETTLVGATQRNAVR